MQGKQSKYAKITVNLNFQKIQLWSSYLKTVNKETLETLAETQPFYSPDNVVPDYHLYRTIALGLCWQQYFHNYETANNISIFG